MPSSDAAPIADNLYDVRSTPRARGRQGLADSKFCRVVGVVANAAETPGSVANVDDLREAAAELLDDHGLCVGLGDAAPLALLRLRQHALAARLHDVGSYEAERLPGRRKIYMVSQILGNKNVRYRFQNASISLQDDLGGHCIVLR